MSHSMEAAFQDIVAIPARRAHTATVIFLHVREPHGFHWFNLI